LEERLANLKSIRSKVTARLAHLKETQEKHAAGRRVEKRYNAGDQVMISAKHLALKRPKHGLGPRYLGPLTVLEPVGENAYRLKLPKTWRIHDVVNVSQLEDWHADPQGEPSHDSSTAGPQLPEEVSASTEYEVEAVADRKIVKGHKIRYLVRCAGDWPDDQKETWEPAANLTGA
jgi:hypothetical protein